MTKKKNVSLAERFGKTVRDMANAASVAATGSEIGVLELAADDQLSPSPVKRARKLKAAPQKKASSKKSSKPIRKKRTAKRR